MGQSPLFRSRLSVLGQPPRDGIRIVFNKNHGGIWQKRPIISISDCGAIELHIHRPPLCNNKRLRLRAYAIAAEIVWVPRLSYPKFHNVFWALQCHDLLQTLKNLQIVVNSHRHRGLQIFP